MKKLYIGLIVLVLGMTAWSAYTASWGRGPRYDPHFWNWPNGGGNKWIAETEDYLDGTLPITLTSPVVTQSVEVFDGNDTLTAAETGKVCVSIGHTGAVDVNTLTLTLPAAAAGLNFTFVDANATATDDLWITAGTGDTINGGTAAKSFKNTGDVVNASCVFTCRDGTDWIAMPSAIGTWANDNN